MYSVPLSLGYSDSSPLLLCCTFTLCVASDANRDSKIIKSSNATKEAHSQVYASVYRLLCTYWVVVVVGAFLIVMLTGQPSVLKCVYLVCFFLFMVTYQVILLVIIIIVVSVTSC